MKKYRILLAGEFALTDDQKYRLDVHGDVDKIVDFASPEEWLSIAEKYDIICSWGDYVLENLPKLKSKLITYPYTELGSFNSDELAKNNVFVANARGGNKKSIVEWTMFSVLSLFRMFPEFLRTTKEHPFTATESLENKKALIIGHGTIGSEVGEMCAAFGMKVDYFNRGNDLVEKIGDKDLVINALNCNPSSENLLDSDFFMNMKKGSFFVTFSRPYTYDVDGLIDAIDKGIVSGAGIDCDPEPLFDITNDFYKKCLSNEKILVTPHLAGVTTQASKNGLEIMVQNVESYCSGKPQNILIKN